WLGPQRRDLHCESVSVLALVLDVLLEVVVDGVAVMRAQAVPVVHVQDDRGVLQLEQLGELLDDRLERRSGEAFLWREGHWMKALGGCRRWWLFRRRLRRCWSGLGRRRQCLSDLLCQVVVV